MIIKGYYRDQIKMSSEEINGVDYIKLEDVLSFIDDIESDLNDIYNTVDELKDKLY